MLQQSWRINEKEYEYLKAVLDNGFPGNSLVNFTAKLEKLFAEKFGAKYAISFTNGTATLHAALAAAGVGPGDEVIVPPLTMAATSMAVLFTGAVPVYADINPDTFLMSAPAVRKCVTPNTKAIIPVSLYGLSPDMDAIKAIADEYHLSVIEDNAQCFLGKYKGKIIGSMGNMASFSFQNSKHITCGEGGMVVTSNPEYALFLRRFSSLGYGSLSAEPGKSKINKNDIVSPEFERHVSLGYNYRLSELCSAFMYAQLEKLEIFVGWRRKCAMAFAEAIGETSWLRPQQTPEDCENSYWAYTVKLATPDVKWIDFYNKFKEFGGEGFYGAWRLTYTEPYFKKIIPANHCHCPIAESTQPYLMQFKTNYGSEFDIDRQAEALAKTIKYFNQKRVKFPSPVKNRHKVIFADAAGVQVSP